MTQHPITPPPELVQEWWEEADQYQDDPKTYFDHVATQAARWGADQELEACVDQCRRPSVWIEDCGYHPSVPEDLRAARRPKPQTLNSIALQMLGTIERDAHYLPEITDTIRRALEALPND
jgi:hypothetical protein